jgi:hypothetical protein
MKMGFADPLKQEVNESFLHLFPQYAGVPADSLDKSQLTRSWTTWLAAHAIRGVETVIEWGDPLCPYGKCVPALQWWGTEYRRRMFGENYWTDRLEDRLHAAELDGYNAVIVIDLRFPNEQWIVHDHKGYTAEVINLNHVPDPRTSGHISERNDFRLDTVVRAASLDELALQGLKMFDNFYNLRHGEVYLEEGDKCPACTDGWMRYPPVEDCRCRVSPPPCYDCVHNPLTCDKCELTVKTSIK